MGNNMKKLFIASLLLFFSHASFAAPTNWYAGIGFGATSADVSESGVQQELAIFEGVPFGSPQGLGETWSSSKDDSDTGITVFIGYLINPNLAVEGAFIDLGDVSARASFSIPGIGTDTVAAKAEADGFSAAVLGLYPVGAGSIFGKVGFLRWDVDVSETITNFLGESLSLSGSDTGTDLLFGVGYQYMANQFGVRAEWTRYTDVGGDFGDTDVDWLGVSVLYSF